MAKKVLVTGVAASGKTTLEKIFDQKGYQTSDIDDGFAEWKNKITGEVEDYRPDDSGWIDQVYWALKVNDMQHRLRSAGDKPIAVFGSTNDLYEHVGLFDAILLMEYPNDEAVKQRLASRSRGFGRVVQERNSVLSYYREYQDQMRDLGAICVGYDSPIDQKVAMIERELLSE
jgi:hypothetical protein